MKDKSFILISAGRTGTPVRRPRRSVKRLMCRAKLGWMRKLDTSEPPLRLRVLFMFPIRRCG
jgi:hypothetical protein